MKTLAITTLCDGDTDLLPFWLEHYKSLGVDHLLICVDMLKCGEVPQAILGDNSITVYAYSMDGEGEMRDEQEREAIRCLKTCPDWIMYTDLDEHQEYQGGMHAALAKADAAGEDIVMGVFCDRLAADGSFTPLPEYPEHWTGLENEAWAARVTLDRAYTLRTNVTRDLIGTRFTKVMAAKPGVVLRPGRHGTLDRPFAAKRAGILDDGHLVHHFKWRAGIVERIRDRMAKLPAEYDWYRRRYGPFLELVEANGGKVPSEYLK